VSQTREIALTPTGDGGGVAKPTSSRVVTVVADELTCVNHPKRTTSLRCNRCDRPMCLRCVELTAVGHRCKECLGRQRAGYYNAMPVDYVIAAGVSLLPSIVAGLVVPYAYFYFALLGGPIGGVVVAETVRWSIGRRRGQFIWLVACAAIVVGGLIGVGLWSLALARSSPQPAAGTTVLASALGSFAVYAAVAAVTVYARLRV
jgi:hypothetical protein